MVSIAIFRTLALAFEEATEQPHFEKPSFRVAKKIFATLDLPARRAVLKLSAIDQSVFCTFDAAIIYPVSGAWGKSGWTVVELKSIRQELLRDALTCAYCTVAPQRLAKKYKQA
jgi:hypothetical protein